VAKREFALPGNSSAFLPFIPFATQLCSTPVTSSNLRNQAPLFTELRLLQGTPAETGCETRERIVLLLAFVALAGVFDFLQMTLPLNKSAHPWFILCVKKHE